MIHSGRTKRTEYTNKGTTSHVMAPAPMRTEPTLIAAETYESLPCAPGLPFSKRSVFFVGLPVGASVEGAL